MKQLYAVKHPAGFVHSIGPDGIIETTKIVGQSELNSYNVARAVALFVISQLPEHKRFSVYPFAIN